MAHYAFLDENNIVTEVIVGIDEGEQDTDWEVHYGNFRSQVCKPTSYNTHGGVHYGGGAPYRMNYAGIGYTYDEARDAFIPPQPYSCCVLDENSCLWQAPVPMPQDGERYRWAETAGEWVAV